MKQYHQETRRIVAEARQAYIAQKADGHDREQAFVEFFQAQAEITEQLGDTDRS